MSLGFILFCSIEELLASETNSLKKQQKAPN